MMSPPKTAAQAAPVRIISVGVGAIGRLALEEAARRGEFAVVGAVDPLRAGDSIGGVEVVGELADLEGAADVAIVATGSSLAAVAAPIEAAVTGGLSVVSTCEALTYPWLSDARLAQRLDEVARENEVAILGCGVNPGFTMDVLPAHMVGASSSVSSVTVTRRVDLAQRRIQLQQKLGARLSVEEWEQRAARDGFGHVGLVESAQLCAVTLGWTVGEVVFAREPVVLDGWVVGVRETARATDTENRTLSLTLVFEIDGVDEDTVEIEGNPGARLRIEGGLHGDAATVARMFHAATVVRSLPPGLRLPIEAPAWSAVSSRSG
jgi:4-hydroxy-tetrahydrodipicolinate reductase